MLVALDSHGREQLRITWNPHRRLTPAARIGLLADLVRSGLATGVAALRWRLDGTADE